MVLKLKSNYNNFENHLEVLPCSIASNVVFVNIHGAFGESGDEGSKSQKIGEIVRLSLAHVVHISTSRDWQFYSSLPKYAQSEAFPGKTFDDEKNDIEDSFDYILNIGEKCFGAQIKKLYVVANSWGGTVISSLVSKYPEIAKLVLCNSGIRSTSTEHPIFTTVLSEDIVKRSATEYRDKLLFLHGELDEVVPVSFQDKLFDCYVKADKTRIDVPGANHNFSALFGKDKELANKAYSDAVLKFLI